MFHGGDSDSTGIIVGACYGAMFGLEGVPLNNYSQLEYRERLERLGSRLFNLSNEIVSPELARESVITTKSNEDQREILIESKPAFPPESKIDSTPGLDAGIESGVFELKADPDASQDLENHPNVPIPIDSIQSSTDVKPDPTNPPSKEKADPTTELGDKTDTDSENQSAISNQKVDPDASQDLENASPAQVDSDTSTTEAAMVDSSEQQHTDSQPTNVSTQDAPVSEPGATELNSEEGGPPKVDGSQTSPTALGKSPED